MTRFLAIFLKTQQIFGSAGSASFLVGSAGSAQNRLWYQYTIIRNIYRILYIFRIIVYWYHSRFWALPALPTKKEALPALPKICWVLRKIAKNLVIFQSFYSVFRKFQDFFRKYSDLGQNLSKLCPKIGSFCDFRYWMLLEIEKWRFWNSKKI